MHDWLPVFVDAMADKQLQSRFKTFRANELCRENIELNICFDLNLHSLTIQVKHVSCVPEACAVFAFVLRLKVHYTFKIA